MGSTKHSINVIVNNKKRFSATTSKAQTSLVRFVEDCYSAPHS